MDFRTQLQSGASPVGSWVSFSDPAAAELVAGLGFDFLVVDTEHASSGMETVENVVRAIDAAPGETDVVVRVPWNDHVPVKRVLDLGVDGVMAPQVKTVQQAEALVEATRYPPAGRRGVAGARASNYGRDIEDYFERANEEVAVVAQVESAEAVDNAADIAAVDGVDTLFVGPADLSANLGCFGEYDHPEFVDAVERTLAAGEATNTPVCTLATSDDQVPAWLDRGFDYLVVGTDIGYLTAGAESAKAAFEEHQ